MESPDDRVDTCVYFCFILKHFGELAESTIGEIILTAAPSDYFEAMGNIGFMLSKGLISVRYDEERRENVYSLLEEGRRIAEDMSSSLDRTFREMTIQAGVELLSRNDRERTVKCDIIRNIDKDRYDLEIKFLNELNGEVLLEMKLYAPDKARAVEMRERFLSKPSFIITRIMNMFLRDDFFMFDK